MTPKADSGGGTRKKGGEPRPGVEGEALPSEVERRYKRRRGQVIIGSKSQTLTCAQQVYFTLAPRLLSSSSPAVLRLATRLNN
jgi:hypothetical protein